MKTELTAFQYLIAIIKWRFSKKKYLGRRFNYIGKRRKVIGETFLYIKFAGLKSMVPKAYINTISFNNGK